MIVRSGHGFCRAIAIEKRSMSLFKRMYVTLIITGYHRHLGHKQKRRTWVYIQQKTQSTRKLRDLVLSPAVSLQLSWLWLRRELRGCILQFRHSSRNRTVIRRCTLARVRICVCRCRGRCYSRSRSSVLLAGRTTTQEPECK